MQIFVTSNQQFGRPGAIKKYDRPFSSLEEMNETLIENWNLTVSPEDIVYVLGNFGWDPTTVENCINVLNGHIYFIEGEYDKATVDVSMLPNADKKMEEIGQIDYLHDIDACMSYWPLSIWPGKYLLSGHPSKKIKTDPSKKIINVSCDRWSYKPVNIKSIIGLFEENNLKKSENKQ
jgi:calcineurin-like phosphoesterase family protein|tara:strand:+ start:26657 stop:27187 length:531 start_codon:yes stop_codon:yes gene_type:complete